MNFTPGGTQFGCIGLKSTPTTFAPGYKSPTAFHQHPLPYITTPTVLEGPLTLYSPYPRPGSHIQNVLRFLPNWCKVQPSTTKIDYHRMLHILTILLRLIVGEIVRSLPELVVSSSILEHVVTHAAGERGAC